MYNIAELITLRKNYCWVHVYSSASFLAGYRRPLTSVEPAACQNTSVRCRRLSAAVVDVGSLVVVVSADKQPSTDRQTLDQATTAALPSTRDNVSCTTENRLQTRSYISQDNLVQQYFSQCLLGFRRSSPIGAETGRQGSNCSPNKIIGEQVLHAASPFFYNLKLKVTLHTVKLLLTQKFSKTFQHPQPRYWCQSRWGGPRWYEGDQWNNKEINYNI